MSARRTAEIGATNDLLRQAAGVLTFALVPSLNSIAGAGGLSGESIGVIANRYRSDFLPANYVLGIWGLIYLGLFSFTVFQHGRRRPPLRLRSSLTTGMAANLAAARV